MLTKNSDVLKVFLFKGRTQRIKGVLRTQLTLPAALNTAKLPPVEVWQVNIGPGYQDY